MLASFLPSIIIIIIAAASSSWVLSANHCTYTTTDLRGRYYYHLHFAGEETNRKFAKGPRAETQAYVWLTPEPRILVCSRYAHFVLWFSQPKHSNVRLRAAAGREGTAQLSRHCAGRVAVRGAEHPDKRRRPWLSAIHPSSCPASVWEVTSSSVKSIQKFLGAGQRLGVCCWGWIWDARSAHSDTIYSLLGKISVSCQEVLYDVNRKRTADFKLYVSDGFLSFIVKWQIFTLTFYWHFSLGKFLFFWFHTLYDNYSFTTFTHAYRASSYENALRFETCYFGFKNSDLALETEIDFYVCSQNWTQSTSFKTQEFLCCSFLAVGKILL